MNNILRMIPQMNDFKKDEYIEFARNRMIKDYDENFSRIMKCEKMSKEHKSLVKIENSLNLQSKNFIEKNKEYFKSKRNYYMTKGVMNRPQVLPLDKFEIKTFGGEEGANA